MLNCEAPWMIHLLSLERAILVMQGSWPRGAVSVVVKKAQSAASPDATP